MKNNVDFFNYQVSNYFKLNPKEQKAVDLSILANIFEYNEIILLDSEDLNNSIKLYEIKKKEYDFKYLEPYLTKILPIVLNKQSKEELMKNRLVIKISGDKDLYDKYLKDIVGLEHKTFLKNFHIFLNENPKFINDFCKKDNLINYNSETESIILDDYFKNILNKKEPYNIKEIELLAKHVCKRESYYNDMKNDVKIVGLIEHIDFQKLGLQLALKRTKEYLTVLGSCSKGAKGGSAIRINTSNFMFKSLSDGNEITAYRVLNVCFHELHHAQQNKRQESETFDALTYDVYMKLKCNAVVIEAKHLYDKRHDDFPAEIEANIVGFEKAINMLEKYAPKTKKNLGNYAKDKLNDNLSRRNIKDFKFIQEELDMIVRKDNSIPHIYKYLKIEYNTDGTRKKLEQLLENDMKVSKEIFDYSIVNLFLTSRLGTIQSSISNLPTNSLNLVDIITVDEVNRLIKQRQVNNQMLHSGQFDNKKWLTNDYIISTRMATLSLIRTTIKNSIKKNEQMIPEKTKRMQF